MNKPEEKPVPAPGAAEPRELGSDNPGSAKQLEKVMKRLATALKRDFAQQVAADLR